MVFIFSARCGTEYVGLARPDHLTPCSTLSRCNMHQTLPWLPCFRFSKGIIIIQTFGISATDIPCRGAAHIFPSSITIPCSICNHPVKIYCPQTNTSWRSSWPLIIPKECFECFVSSKIFHIFSVKNDTFYTKKYHHTDIQFSTNHESLSQPIMKIGFRLHYCFSLSFCFIIDSGRIKFD